MMATQVQMAGYVPEAYGCPYCGERRIDELIWQDDYELVQCQSCGFRYDPSEPDQNEDRLNTQLWRDDFEQRHSVGYPA